MFIIYLIEFDYTQPLYDRYDYYDRYMFLILLLKSDWIFIIESLPQQASLRFLSNR